MSITNYKCKSVRAKSKQMKTDLWIEKEIQKVEKTKLLFGAKNNNYQQQWNHKTYFQSSSSSGITGEFDWDSKDQGIVLGAYFYGNIATQIIGGILAEKIGGKWVFGFGGFVAAVATLLSPVAARAGMGWFIAIRTIIGIGQVLKI